MTHRSAAACHNRASSSQQARLGECGHQACVAPVLGPCHSKPVPGLRFVSLEPLNTRIGGRDTGGEQEVFKEEDQGRGLMRERGGAGKGREGQEAGTHW